MKVQIISDEGKVSGEQPVGGVFLNGYRTTFVAIFLFVAADALFLERLHRRVFGEEYVRK
ncbi:hypothetical protein YY29_003646 [Salmonella enterica subsp. enterica]|uniref:Uncharacterized protein n=1 Tax=Salmonella enterica TaxID=28901 RepID=A0A743FND8_SALER|nr:hypothetical protein [Salmonella enterica subsp. enterica serovar Newport]EDV9436509.1 hypothetical protein [Salmonella enterica subsp. enterica]EEK5903106.1 hypothetical protein [Salmonella enterica subsp. enterica serovar Madelia]HAF1932772.1 hypothetical protein [Salmonella enterica]